MKYFKSHYPERMVPMRTKINEMLGKIPNPVLLALLLIIGTVDGSVMAKANLTEASITHGFTSINCPSKRVKEHLSMVSQVKERAHWRT